MTRPVDHWDSWERQTTAEERRRVHARDGYRCRYCGTDASELEVDHIVPRSQGGSNDPQNLVSACQDCNRRKSDETWHPLPVFDDELAAEEASWARLEQDA